MEEMRDAYKILVGKPEREKSLGGPRVRWKDNTEVNLCSVRM
jgi:hypothetical protein